MTQTRTLFTNAKIITETHTIQQGWLLVEGTTISAFHNGNPPAFDDVTIIDANGLTLMAGFIDVHVHGSVGKDTMDASIDGLQQMAEFYAQNGVTSFLPTTWTDSRERIYNAMQAVKQAQTTTYDGAKILGAHMEGPYLNGEFAGAQNPNHIRRADVDEMNALFDLDVIRLISLAPEFEENHWLIQACVQRGITVSVAHSSANYEQIIHAFDLGVTHSTHTYNAMTGLHHRKPGIVGAVMTTEHINAELIADTIHVHPTSMHLLWKTKRHDHLMLITDAIRAAGMPDGEYTVDDRTIIVKDSACRLPDGTLAGSIIRFNQAVRNFKQAVGEPLETFWQATSLNAARSIGVSDRKGSIAQHKDADLILVDAESLDVHLTMVEGRIVHQQNH